MKHHTTFSHLLQGLLPILVGVLAVGGVLLRAQPASAQGTCIQDVWKAHGGSQNLTCTAQDVTLSQVTGISISSGGSCDPQTGVCTCNLGGNVTFTADFRMDLTADTRYDVGFYIATDNDPNNDGALTGTCAATNVTAVNSDTFTNLDAAPDSCGDITGPLGTDFNPQIVRFTLSVPCTDDDANPGNDRLDLAFCTTWRQPGSNGVCDEVNDAFPGSPSKCNCGSLAIDIFFETANIEVTKTALPPAQVPEEGGNAVYSVAVRNLAQVADVTLDTLCDDRYGDLTLSGLTCPGGPFASIVSSDCTLATIAAQQTYTCMFTGAVPPGDTGGTFVDSVTACGTDGFGNTELCDSDDAAVTYTDVPQPPSLSKTVTATACTVVATYAVVVTNGSAQDELTLNTLSDNKFGNLNGQGDCSVPQTIAPSGTYSCSFEGTINLCSGTHTDVVTAGATDDDGATYTLTDDASVTVNVTF